MTNQRVKSSCARCIVCNKVLTDPNFVLLQMGPTCAKKYNKSPTRYDRSLAAATNTDLGLQRITLNTHSLDLAMKGELSSRVDSNPEKFEKIYLNDRKSSVAQLGEDVRGAARHKSLVWSSLKDAEELGMAEQLITRENLIKNMNKDGIKALAKKDYEKAVVLATYLKKLPKNPEALTNAKYGSYHVEKAEAAMEADKPYAIGWDENHETGRYDRMELNHRGYEWDDVAHPKVGLSKEDYLQLRRKFFYENYEFAQGVVDKALNKEDLDQIDSNQLIRFLGDESRKQVRENNYGYMGNHNGAFTKWYNSTVASRSTQSLLGAAREYNSLGIPGGEDNIVSYLEGQSLRASFGRKKAVSSNASARKKEIKLSDFYGNEATRIGPEISEKTQKQLETALVGDIGLRGFQYGRSLPDAERLEHLRHMVESVDDLCDVIGIKRKDFSLGQTLAIAVGARGKSSAMAHYEPSDKIINITRKNGVGSLCHEWFHGLDHNTGEAEGGSRYLSERSSTQSSSPKVKAYENFQKELAPFLERMMKSPAYRGLSNKKKSYFSSRKEVFARVGEKMIDYKLRQKDRVNTYLSGCTNETFYPNDEEMKLIEPFFDKVLKSIFNQSEEELAS